MFPQFLEHVTNVLQIDDSHLKWTVPVNGSEPTGEADITEQIPDERIAWRGTGGPKNEDSVRFDRVRENVTRATLGMEYDPTGFGGASDDAVRQRLQDDLGNFKTFTEQLDTETGVWRGEIETS